MFPGLAATYDWRAGKTLQAIELLAIADDLTQTKAGGKPQREAW
jgi:hypothetical protein